VNTAPWLNPMLRLLQVVTWLVLLLYPLAVWVGLTRWGTTVLAPLLVTVFTLRLLVLRGKLRQQMWLGKGQLGAETEPLAAVLPGMGQRITAVAVCILAVFATHGG
jgi:uncharacterized protein YhhL (DUF1145 family)